MTDATQLLHLVEEGDPQGAEQLLPLVYDELRKLAAAQLSHEKPGQTLQATALVHEAYLRLLGANNAPSGQTWNSRGHFFGAAAEAMRRILIEQARRKKTTKAGAQFKRVDLAEIEPAISGSQLDLLALNEALVKLEEADPRAAAVVKLRFFAGLTSSQAAEALGISPATAENDWAYARCQLRLQLEEPPATE